MNEMAELAGYVFVDPTAYADEARFEASCALLRNEDPVHWVEGEGLGFNGFWPLPNTPVDLRSRRSNKTSWMRLGLFWARPETIQSAPEVGT